MTPELLIIAMIGAHAFLDYAGQGDFMAKAKSRSDPIPGIPWWNILGAHAAMHGSAVALLTGIWWLFIAETVIHFVTDDAKCHGKITFNQDQAIHAVCKFIWLAVWVTFHD